MYLFPNLHLCTYNNAVTYEGSGSGLRGSQPSFHVLCTSLLTYWSLCCVPAWCTVGGWAPEPDRWETKPSLICHPRAVRSRQVSQRSRPLVCTCQLWAVTVSASHGLPRGLPELICVKHLLLGICECPAHGVTDNLLFRDNGNVFREVSDLAEVLQALSDKARCETNLF